MKEMSVAVIGACGRVGFGLSLVLAEAGYQVFGVDINVEAVDAINDGKVPFMERGAEAALSALLPTGRLKMTMDPSVVKDVDTVVMIPGTPIDAHHNPDLRPLVAALDEVAGFLRAGQLIILRSTVSPGATSVVKDLAARISGLEPDVDFDLVFAPERVVEGRSLEESREIPQIVGAFSDRGFERAERFFGRFNGHPCIRVSPCEAELAKLMCNMYRYAQFALANELFLIAESFGADAHRVIAACNSGYGRAAIPRPGPNVGGPCLSKDGWFLLEGIPFAGMISSAFHINEGMPAQIIRKLEAESKMERVGVLGLSFKPECDDPRSSLSYKLIKQLRRRGIEVITADPYLASDGLERFAGLDAVVLMTPHEAYRDPSFVARHVGRGDCVYCGIWGYWGEKVPAARNGMFRGRDLLWEDAELTRELARIHPLEAEPRTEAETSLEDRP